MCRLKGDDAAADKAQAAVDKMKDNIMKYGWDGEWFLRAYDDFGKKMALTNVKKARSSSNRRASLLWAAAVRKLVQT